MSTTSLRMERYGRWAVGTASVLTVFVIWYGATTLQWLSPGFVPELPAVFSALVHLADSGELAQDRHHLVQESGVGDGVLHAHDVHAHAEGQPDGVVRKGQRREIAAGLTRIRHETPRGPRRPPFSFVDKYPRRQ